MTRYKVITSKTHNEMIDLFYKKDYPDKVCKEITFQVTEACCLKCTYCYQLHKTSKTMDFETAKEFIDMLLADKFTRITTENTLGLSIHFIGGEPFMAIELITDVWEYLINRMIELDHPWLYKTKGNICSNGVPYFNEKVQSFMKKYHNMFSFSISIDGNKELHDACRIDFDGNGSYDRAIAAVHHYRDSYGFMPGVKMTLSPENIAYTYDAVVNLLKEGYDQIFLNCVYEEGWTWEHANILYKELVRLSDYIIDNGFNEAVHVSMFDEELFAPLDERDEDVNWCGGVGEVMFSLSPEGDYYTCIRYMESSLNGEQKPLKLGSVKTGYLSNAEEKQNFDLLQNITRTSQSTKECLECPVARGCAWCSGLNYQKLGTPNKRLTFICPMHKARALANVYYWNKIYKKYGADKVFENHLAEEDIRLTTKEEED